LTASVAFITDYSEARPDFPKDFLDLYTEDGLSALDDSLAKVVADFIVAGQDTPEFGPTLVLLGTLVEWLAETLPENEFSTQIVPLVEAALGNAHTIVRAAAAFCVHAIGDSWGNFHSPDDIFATFVPLVAGADGLSGKYACNAVRGFISTGALLPPAYLTRYLAAWGDHSTWEAQRRFGKVLTTYIFPGADEEEEEDSDEKAPNLQILQPIVDWIAAALESDSEHTNAIALDALGDVTACSALCAEDLVSRALSVAAQLVDAGAYDTFELLSNFVVSYVTGFKDAAADASGSIDALVVGLVGALQNDAVGSLKQRLKVAAACAQVIADGIGRTQTEALIAFIITVIRDCGENDIFRACGPILSLKKVIGRDAANAIFAALLPRLLQTRSDRLAAAFARTLEKLLKRYAIDDEYIETFVDAVLGARVQVFWGNAPNRVPDLGAAIFGLLGHVVKQAPSRAAPIVSTLLDWLDQNAYDPVPLFLPLGAALSVGGINAGLAARLAPIAKQALQNCEADDADTISVLAPLLRELFAKFPAALEPVRDVLQAIVPLAVQAAKAAAGDEEEDADDSVMDSEELIEAMPEVMQLVFDIYASPSPVNAIPELLVPLVGLLPFPPGSEGMGDLMQGLCLLLNDTKRFSCIADLGGFILTGLLMMKKSELDGYEFDAELIKTMKGTLKKLCKANKKLEARLKAQFKGSRAKLNHFAALIR
jgi:hypothetical protein